MTDKAPWIDLYLLTHGGTPSLHLPPAGTFEAQEEALIACGWEFVADSTEDASETVLEPADHIGRWHFRGRPAEFEAYPQDRRSERMFAIPEPYKKP